MAGILSCPTFPSLSRRRLANGSRTWKFFSPQLTVISTSLDLEAGAKRDPLILTKCLTCSDASHSAPTPSRDIDMGHPVSTLNTLEPRNPTRSGSRSIYKIGKMKNSVMIAYHTVNPFTALLWFLFIQTFKVSWFISTFY